MSTGVGSQLKYPALRDLSPGAQAAAAWFRGLARALRTCRLYAPDNPVVVQIRQQLLDQLKEQIQAHGVWRLRITPSEIWLQDEPIIHPIPKSDPDALPDKEQQLPFAFYRDGIRRLTFLPDIPSQDFDSLFDAMVAVGSGPMAHDDLVTLLWQANPVRILFEAVPMQQTIYLSSDEVAGGGGGEARRGLAYDWSPSGEEIHADLGQMLGAAQGLHLDTFDDWPLPNTFVDVPTAYQQLTRGMEFVRSILLSEWGAERSIDWSSEVPGFFRRVLALDGSPETRAALAQSVVTWVAGAVQSCSWLEGQGALTLLRELDPDGTLGEAPLHSAMAGLDVDAIAKKLDESEVEAQTAFFALAVSLGRPALDLGVSILRLAEKARTRAAACTMLCYLCGDEPGLLATYLTDSRWYVVRNTVFVLGQIGGPEVVELLELAAQHPDARVRRQVVQSLGGVPAELRVPILAHQLQTEDLRLLAASLSMLARHHSREATRALLHQIQAPDFETRSVEHQRMIFNAVAELGDDAAVPGLSALLRRGGWFARRTPQRLAAAQALRRIGTERALKELEDGMRTGNDAVKAACLEALSWKGKA
jgi:HEAT repeat protein